MKETSLKIYLNSDLNLSQGMQHIFSELEDYAVELIESGKLIRDNKQPHLHIIHLTKSNSEIVSKILAIKNPRKERYFFLVSEFSIASLSKLARRGYNKIFVLPDDMEEFKSALMIEVKGLNLTNQGYYSKLSVNDYVLKSIIGGSEDDQLKIDNILSAAKTHLNFIIEGEIGLGKSRLAKTIHKCSPHSKFVEFFTPFTTDGLFSLQIESESAPEFYDEIPDFEISKLIANSTIFIKNLHEIDTDHQKRLLRILNDRHANFRIIATTNENLEDRIISGELLDELYYMLNGSYIELTPLRYRPDDLQHLFSHLVLTNSKKLNKKITKIEPDVFEFVNSYPWLGNIQELDNAIVNAITFSSNNVLSLTDFANIIIRNTDKENFLVRTTDVLPNTVYLEVDFLSTKLEDLNRKYASVVLSKFESNKSKVAEILGITRPTLKKLTE